MYFIYPAVCLFMQTARVEQCGPWHRVTASIAWEKAVTVSVRLSPGSHSAIVPSSRMTTHLKS